MVIALEKTPMPAPEKKSPDGGTKKYGSLSGSVGEEAFAVNVKECSTPQKEERDREGLKEKEASEFRL